MRLTLRILCILVFCVVLVNTQQRRNNNRNRNNRVTPAPTVGGRWRPSVVTRRRPVASGNNRGGSGNRRSSTVQRRPLEPSELITPPSRRLPGEAPLQEPSWVHCMNNMEITNSWAMISNRGYPEAIVGQMQCSWIFFSARNTRIRISFYDIDLQPGEAGRCGTQFVDVIDLQLQKSQGRFCGDQIPGDYVSMSNSLRLDIQGDTTIISHRGFRAFVRSEPLTVQAGLRQRSLKFHGRITTTRRPTTTQRPIIRRTPTPNNRVRQPIRTRAPPTYQRPGQNIYGPNRQPQITDDTSPPSSPSVGIYVLIGLLCVMIVLMGLAFLFRKRLRKRYDEFRGKEGKEKKKPDDDIYKPAESTYMAGDKLSLPGYSPKFQRRKSGCGCSRSVTFEDEIEEEAKGNSVDDERYCQPCTYDSVAIETNSTGRYDPQWDFYRSRCPEDDTLSVQSFQSARSTNRHPEHASFKIRKIEEMNNYSFYRGENPYGEVPAHNPEPIYSTQIDPMSSVYYVPPMAVAQYSRPNYDEMMRQQRQQAAYMMQELQGMDAAKSMGDLTPVPTQQSEGLKRSASMAKLPVESEFLKRHVQRRQSFRL